MPPFIKELYKHMVFCLIYYEIMTPKSQAVC